MRLFSPALALLLVLPAQGGERRWYAGVHLYAPGAGGHFQGLSDGERFQVDLGRDLGLARDRAQAGFALEYQGPRFGLSLAIEQERYAGRNQLDRDVIISNQVFRGGSVITSTLRATDLTFDWTVRAYAQDDFWVGLDLGVRSTTLTLDARGVVTFPGITADARHRTSLPVPQAGPALGFTALDGRLTGRAQALFLTWRGATYNHLGFSLRYFPVSWLGVEVFADSERFRVPDGTLAQGLDITLDRTGTGVGVVARF